MINPIEDYYEQKVLYLYEGKAWKLIAYCPTPSVTMECVTTKEQMNFGIGGLTARKFKLIEEKKNGESRRPEHTFNIGDADGRSDRVTKTNSPVPPYPYQEGS